MVHVFTCVLGHILASILLLKAQRAGATSRSQEHLLTELEKVRRATILRLAGPKRKPTVSTQLEQTSPELAALAGSLGIAC